MIDNGDGTHTVTLTRGTTAIIDSVDADRVGAHNWTALLCPDGRVYAKRQQRGQGTIYLHRFILNAPPDTGVDHINRDTLDYRRSNLRLATQQQNVWNTQAQRGSKSAYKGVAMCGRQWIAQITANGTHYRLGRFSTEVDAARAYDAAAIRLHGEFAYLNFPDD